MSAAALKFTEFRPKLPWWTGDLQTLRNYALNLGLALPGKAVERIETPLEDGSGDRLVASLHLPQRDRRRPLIALVHGLGGCQDSCYMVMASAYFLARGYPVLRVNQRGAGPSRPHCRLQYHAGSTGDFAALLDKLDARLTGRGVLPVGFSLGGNMLLKFLGEAGRNSPIRRAATVSAPLDLAGSCKALMRWRNYGYHRYLLANVKRNCTAAGAALSDAERSAILKARTLWQFDHTFTAPRNGYASADDLYTANASRGFLGGIRTPTLVIHAQDDPFVPVAPYLEVPWSDHPRLLPLLPRGGGHLGFHDPSGVWYLHQIEAFFAHR